MLKALAPSIGFRTLLSPKQASEMLNIPESTLRDWRCSGLNGPSFCKLGRLVRYRPEDLEAWLDAQTVGVLENH